MKKSLLLFVAVCFAFMAEAQVSQGSFSVGGSLLYSNSSSKYHSGSNTVKGGTSTNFSFGPRVGYFISDGVSIGAAVIIESSSSPNNNWHNNPVEYKESRFYFNPYARFHKSIGERFFLFGEGMIHIGSGNSKTINGNVTNHGDKLSIVGLSVSPGIIYFPAEKVGLELSFDGLGFYSVTNKDYENSSNKSVSSSFRIGSDTFAPRLGIQFYL